MIALLSLLTACDRDSLYSETTFSENVYKAYSGCRASEIRFLTGKHNIQTAFEPCGSNNIQHFAWAPDGIQLYFQLPMQANILNGEDKTIGTMPTELPMANAVWLASDLLVLPLIPAKGQTEHRLLLFDRIGATTTVIKVPHAPAQLQAAGNRREVYYLATQDDLREDGAESQLTLIYKADFNVLETAPAFTWAQEADTFTFEPTQQLVAIGVGETVRIHKAGDGEVVHVFEGAHRGIIHPEGRYIALESWGDPISPFDQRTWDEVSPETRERETRRMEEWLERQPEWVPKEQQPPVIEIVDLEVKQRVEFSAFYGDKFQWYTASNYYASFALWGLEGKEVNRNVALTQLGTRLALAAEGTLPMGMERVEETPTPDQESVSPVTPSDLGG